MNLHKNTTAPARLGKKDTWDEKMSRFDRECSFLAMKYAGALIMLLTIVLVILFVILCLVLIPPVESGLYYNHFLEGNL